MMNKMLILFCGLALAVSMSVNAKDKNGKITDKDRAEFKAMVQAMQKSEQEEALQQQNDLAPLRNELTLLRSELSAYVATHDSTTDAASIKKSRNAVKERIKAVLKEEKNLAGKKHLAEEHKDKLGKKVREISKEVLDGVDQGYSKEKLDALIARLEIKSSPQPSSMSMSGPLVPPSIDP